MKLLLLVLAVAGLAAAQTVYVGSATQPMLAGAYAVAPGSLVVANVTGAFPDLTGVDPANVQFALQPTSASRVFQIPVSRVEAHRVWAVLPPDIPLGRANVTLAMGKATATGTAYLTVSSFSLFASMKNGSGPAVAQNQPPGGAPVVNQLTTPAVPGDYVTLWGTGLGPFTASDISVTVYDQEVKPTFAGHAPGMPGVDQINLRLPSNIATGCYVPVTVTLPDADVSNHVALAIADASGTPCKHPLGLSADQLKTLDQGGRVMVGWLNSSGLAAPGSNGLFQRVESASVSFVAADAQHVFNSLLASIPTTPFCTTVMSTGFLTTENPYADPTVFADAGPSLVLRSPEDRALTLPKRNGNYAAGFNFTSGAPTLSALPPETLIPGSWTMSATGGDDIPAFDAPFAMAPAMRWIDRDTLYIIDRQQDLVISWATNDIPSGIAVVTILAPQSSGSSPAPTGALQLGCLIASQTGRMVLPSEWLEELVTTDPKVGSFLTLTLVADPSRPTLVQVPLKSGGTAPVAIGRTVGETIPIVIQ